jgi:hypothetical protein
MSRFLSALFGGPSGAYFVWVLSVSSWANNAWCVVIGGLWGVMCGWTWGASFAIPVTATALGTVLGGTGVLWWLMAEAHAHHRQFGDTQDEGAWEFMLLGAIPGAAAGCACGIGVVRRWTARYRRVAGAAAAENGEACGQAGRGFAGVLPGRQARQLLRSRLRRDEP